MRFRNGYLLHKTNSKGDYVVAALHWHWSITWRWTLWIRFTKKLRPFFRYSKSFHGQYYIDLHLPCMLLTFQTQENMKRSPKVLAEEL
jgi:hypothetical protein